MASQLKDHETGSWETHGIREITQRTALRKIFQNMLPELLGSVTVVMLTSNPNQHIKGFEN